MAQHLSPELAWLAAVALMTGLLWLPYVANRFRELGPPAWQWSPPPDPPARAAWADRAARAHANAVENLAVFAPLVLAVHAAGVSSRATAIACAVYFFARLAHYVIGLFGVPIALRTVAFLAGVGAQVTLALAVLRTAL